MNHIEEQRNQIEAELAALQASLAELESGKRRHFEKVGDGPFRDITSELIAERRRAVVSYSALLALLGRPQKLPS